MPASLTAEQTATDALRHALRRAHLAAARARFARDLYQSRLAGERAERRAPTCTCTAILGYAASDRPCLAHLAEAEATMRTTRDCLLALAEERRLEIARLTSENDSLRSRLAPSTAVAEPEPRRQLLFVCAPTRGRTPDDAVETDRAIRRALSLGWCPVWQLDLLDRHLREDEPHDRLVALDCSISLLEQCDALLVVGHQHTPIMKLELDAWQRSNGFSPFLWPNLSRPGGAA